MAIKGHLEILIFSSLLVVVSLTSCTKTVIIPAAANITDEPLGSYQSSSGQQRQAIAQEQGVVSYVWEEPMVDVVDVPPGLDPEGHYYRRGHQSVVEVRQGRWRYNP